MHVSENIFGRLLTGITSPSVTLDPLEKQGKENGDSLFSRPVRYPRSIISFLATSPGVKDSLPSISRRILSARAELMPPFNQQISRGGFS